MTENGFLYALGGTIGFFVLLYAFSGNRRQDSGFKDDAFTPKAGASGSGGSPKGQITGKPKSKTSEQAQSPKLFLPAYVISGEQPWEILGVTPDADAATVQKAHRHLIRMLHPDRFQAEGDRKRAAAAAQRINHARDALLKGMKK